MTECTACQYNRPMVSLEPTDTARRACRYVMKPLPDPPEPIFGCPFENVPPLPDYQPLPDLSEADAGRAEGMVAALEAHDEAEAIERQKEIDARPRRPIFMWYEGREPLYITERGPLGINTEALPEEEPDAK